MGRCRRDGRLGGRPRRRRWPLVRGRVRRRPRRPRSRIPAGLAARPQRRGAASAPTFAGHSLGGGRAGSCRSRCRPRDGTSCGRWGLLGRPGRSDAGRATEGWRPRCTSSTCRSASRSSSSSCWVSRSRPWSRACTTVVGAWPVATGRHCWGSSSRACLWWVYFDLAGGGGQAGAGRGGRRERRGHATGRARRVPLPPSADRGVAGCRRRGPGVRRPSRWRGRVWMDRAGCWRSACRDTCSAARVIQAAMSRGARGPLLWPGAGVPAVLVIAWFDPAPLVLLGPDGRRPPDRTRCRHRRTPRRLGADRQGVEPEVPSRSVPGRTRRS